MTTVITDTIRGVAVVSLSGTRALECLSDYELPVLLRRYDPDTGLDVGATNLRPFDLQTAPTAGNGYELELWDANRNTLLAEGAATQRGQRAGVSYTLTQVPATAETLELSWTDLSNPDAPTTATRTYLFDSATAPPSTVVANTIRTTGLTGAAGLQEAIDRIIRAINGTLDSGDLVSAGLGTEDCPELIAYSSVAGNLTIEARDGGVWGNMCVAVATGAFTANNTTTAFTGGTGNRGIALTWDAGDLPNSVMETTNDVMRRCHADLFGLYSDHTAEAPSRLKLVSSPTQVHKSAGA